MLISWFLYKEKKQLKQLKIRLAVDETRQQQYQTLLKERLKKDLNTPQGHALSFTAGGVTGLVASRPFLLKTLIGLGLKAF
ncbi:hypothetical protein [Gayadomonas joobiniege]|uniref:hypothetical protein n=1 Tax=Gayadomonas joobiniege TaxID=1234606 RepID=UPI0003664664|nr:hypothetical protein [Gayadomonas joobiniege]